MNNFTEIIKQSKPVLVDFYAAWCGPCKMMNPILKEVKDAVGTSAVILKINVDNNQNLAAQYQVRGVPTLLLFKEGKQVWRQSGVVEKNSLIDLIQKHH
jgi:thioredoxin 1